MAKGKDFYGKDVTEVIARACKEMSAAQEDLNIEVLETGSAGIFGLCKKKAHIRVTRKKQASGKGTAQPAEKTTEPVKKSRKEAVGKGIPEKNTTEPQAAEPQAAEPPASEPETVGPAKPEKAKKKPAAAKKKAGQPAAPEVSAERKDSASLELASEEVLATIKEDVAVLLEQMGFPSEVTVALVKNSVECRIGAEHQEALVGSEGRTLDSLQYLLRKMMARRLPERMMLSLDVGDYRERRAEELKDRAIKLAARVKEDGKTQAIAALNPSERRVVHMILQEDKDIRSRSVGEGLFKKVLIYKPGKKNKSASRKGKGKGRQGSNSSGNQ